MTNLYEMCIFLDLGTGAVQVDLFFSVTCVVCNVVVLTVYTFLLSDDANFSVLYESLTKPYNAVTWRLSLCVCLSMLKCRQHVMA